ncbi:MAG TPA: hypothetical protein VJV79_08905 [Polyangiaceae bacterium]|nr:hypothetical protein [Polyangiaceae bacterium]
MKPDSGHLDLERLKLADAPELRRALDAVQQQLPNSQQLAALAASLSQLGLPVEPPAQGAATTATSTTRLKLLLGSAGVIGPLALALLLWRPETPREVTPARLERSSNTLAQSVTPSFDAPPGSTAGSKIASKLPASPAPSLEPSAVPLASSMPGAAAADEYVPLPPASPAQVRSVPPRLAPTPTIEGTRSPLAPNPVSVPTSTPGVAARPTEVALLRDAQLALRTQPAEALALAEQHRVLFGRGAMVQERELIAITALVRLGRHTAVLARAAQFERDFPSSPYRKQVSALAQ